MTLPYTPAEFKKLKSANKHRFNFIHSKASSVEGHWVILHKLLRTTKGMPVKMGIWDVEKQELTLYHDLETGLKIEEPK